MRRSQRAERLVSWSAARHRKERGQHRQPINPLEQGKETQDWLEYLGEEENHQNSDRRARPPKLA